MAGFGREDFGALSLSTAPKHYFFSESRYFWHILTTATLSEVCIFDGMAFLLYAPYVYALLLLVIGFIASRRFQWNGYFWGALGLAELSRLGQMLFLVQNFGQPIYIFQPRGSSAILSYAGLYVAGGTAFVGVVAGFFLLWRQKRAFPGVWVGGLSMAEMAILGILRLFL